MAVHFPDNLERDMARAAESLVPFFEPRSIAIAGASKREGTIGEALISNLIRCNYPGRIFPVHPTEAQIAGKKAYRSLREIPEAVDLVVIAVPAAQVEAVMADCVERGAKTAVVISAGFAEVSAEGRATEQRMREMARKAGLRMLGPNCLGFVSTDPKCPVNASFSPDWPQSGNVAMLSQSGALGLSLLDALASLGLGVSSFVSVGNKADISGNDLLAYWAADPRTDVIAMYLESFGNPRRFAKIAPRVARSKPIIALKSGRTAAGKRAAASHSAAIASQDRAVDALFRQAGVIRAETVEELLDTLRLLATQPLPPGPRVGVVTNSGGPAILFADACEARRLEMPPIGENTAAQLRPVLPEMASLKNPIDMLAAASPEAYENAIDLAGNDASIDAVVAIYTPPRVTKPEEIAAAIARGAAKVPSNKPVLAVFCAGREVPRELHAGPRGPIACYRYPENAAVALSHAIARTRWLERPRGAPYVLAPEKVKWIRRIIEGARGWLTQKQVSELLAAAEIELARSEEVPFAEAIACARRIGYPVVVKAVAPGLLHKTDIGGVILGIAGEKELETALGQLAGRAARAGFVLERVLIQAHITGGAEAFAGMALDPNLGPVLVAGSGGIEAEAIDDFAFRLTPLSDLDAAEMLEGLVLTRRLEQHRGAPPRDVPAFREALLRLSALIEAAPEILELDVNPLLIRAEGEGAVALDARIRVADQ